MKQTNIKRYFIEDNEGSFWCENYKGYWSNTKHPEWSLERRFEGTLIKILPLYLMMRFFIKDYIPKLRGVKK